MLDSAPATSKYSKPGPIALAHEITIEVDRGQKLCLRRLYRAIQYDRAARDVCPFILDAGRSARRHPFRGETRRRRAASKARPAVGEGAAMGRPPPAGLVGGAYPRGRLI